ncbi:MAG: peptidoglycan DD-metalloendopeptidase family protein [Candidatus Thiodiazotropha sp.]
MDDFKSYTLSRQTPRRLVIKRLFLAALFLVLLAGGFLYLISSEEKADQAATSPKPIEHAPEQQTPDKVVVPLSLPGQPKEGRISAPRSESISFIPTAQAEEPPPAVTEVTEVPEMPAEQPQIVTDEPAISAVETHQLQHTIKSGESLSSIFKKHGLSANLLHRIVHSSDTAKQLTDIRPGESLLLELDSDDNLQRLQLVHNKIRSLEITASGDSFNALELNREVEPRTAFTSGTIESSLYEAAKGAGLSENLIMELANIFGWDIDFALEIRAGDRFTVIYQEDYLDGEKLRDGPILAAEFINRGRSYRALRYEDETGRADYFTPEGRSMRKAFLRAPVDFRRISSRFTQERWHPVLGKKRPHRGVDYAAKIGTPVKASGDGKIIHRGTKGGYGRTVIIQHGQRYTTLYAHLSRYNKNAKNGSRVKQGQIIGYVGQSGLATGPHLHYEFRVNGVHRNPLTVKLPAAEPIAKRYLEDFKLKTQPLLARLETISQTMVANAE